MESRSPVERCSQTMFGGKTVVTENGGETVEIETRVSSWWIGLEDRLARESEESKISPRFED